MTQEEPITDTRKSTSTHPFETFVFEARAKGGFHNDDIVAVVIPLFEEVLTFHDRGQVAPLAGLQHILITNERLDIDENFSHAPRKNTGAIEKFSANAGRAFELTEEQHRVELVSDTVSLDKSPLPVETDVTKPVTHPVYFTGYRSYEQVLGHHDALTDIYSLGMLLASVSLGLNFNDEEDLRHFVDSRNSLMYLNRSLHPTIANLIYEMTELYRHRRARDLNDIIQRLKNFRDYNPERQYDLSKVHGFLQQDISSKQHWILQRLKSRLFDLTKRNRLLYFRPNLKFVNLTVASVPNVIQINNIKPEHILTWSEDFEKRVAAGKSIALSSFLKEEDNPYLPAYLDRVRIEAMRDKKEFGFSQLKLVACFLNWYNFKEDANERIQTPFVLIPVQLVKKKGLKDQYVLEVQDTVAEVNPVLVYVLKETYGLQLPDKIDLSEVSVRRLYEELVKQITTNKSGIQLELIDKPRVKLIHTQAKQIVAQYQRRLRNKGKHLQHHSNYDYSYKPEDFQPLGLQIFKKQIEPKASYLEWLVNDSIQTVNAQYFDAPNRNIISLGNETNNHFRWEFDLCNVVLGNFNYKKMSLVSDYNSIVKDRLVNSVFDDVFSDVPKPLEEEKNGELNFKEQYPVITADPTQTNAIAFAQKQKSYIIQGPPGTGKSQTITNLIADFVARGKKVLFVCEKRAALDVVYYRLKQQGLHELCCLIHDSQEDKKQFIQELKATFEKYRKEEVDLVRFETNRAQILIELERQLKTLQAYEAGLSEENERTGITLRRLLQRLIELGDKYSPLDAAALEQLPGYKNWLEYGKIVNDLGQTLKRISGSESWAAHPLSSVKADLLLQEQPASAVQKNVQSLQKSLQQIEQEIQKHGLSAEMTADFQNLYTLVRNAATLKPLVETGNIQLLDYRSPQFFQFRQTMSDFRQLQNQYKEQLTKNSNWLNKLNEQDIAGAKTLVEKWEGKFYAFISGEFRRLKALFKQSYDFTKHAVPPSLKQLLADLEKEYDLMKQVREHERKSRELYRTDNLLATEILVNNIQQQTSGNYFSYFLEKGAAGEKLAMQLSALDDEMTRASTLSRTLLNTFTKSDFKALNQLLQSLLDNLNHVAHVIPHIKELHRSPENFVRFVSEHPLNVDALEATLAYGNLLREYRRSGNLQDTDDQLIGVITAGLKNIYTGWMECNAQYILANHHNNFRKKLQWADSSNAQVKAEEREAKRNYNEGRRTLENEFGKQMRYKPIRELATGASGQVIKDLKPVWLMSPLSVSDTLPVDSNFFDVVIFDEASQITLEEGIPPVFRAKQSIIVGDEMQMPPTNFFNTATQDPDDIFDEESDTVVSLDADSLLVQASRKLPSVMLGWHYRSRSESLISFSNHAFYKAGLLTIPDQTLQQDELNEILVERTEHAADNLSYLYDRSISFHFLKNGLYDARTNASEAQYIAHLVLTLLKKKAKESIGIVAFSMEQQLEIETALETLAENWKMTAELEEAYQRTEDDQFVGLFIKNLENVQGDERDIIVMSICYGRDSNKRMIMNFGPINRKGGEKRLNVIFSRAKKHMAVVSSIKYTDITNEYNEGANFFRRYLHYAELVSTGRQHDAMSVLHTLSLQKHKEEIAISGNCVADEIERWLVSLGYHITRNIGQSYFKCEVGVKKEKGQKQFDLGILLDTQHRGGHASVMEQYFQRPLIMEAFGWNVVQVLTKDWFHQKEHIMKKILDALKGKT